MKTKKDNIQSDEQFTGVFIPRYLAEQLSLLAFHQNTSRSAILRDALEKVAVAKKSTTALISSIAKNAYSNWAARKNEPFDLYKGRIVSQLIRKRIPQQHIKKILEQVEKHYATKTSFTKRSSQTTRSDKSGG